jgi:hypothetical protein
LSQISAGTPLRIISRCGFYNYDITQYSFKVESLKEDYYKDTLSIIRTYATGTDGRSGQTGN